MSRGTDSAWYLDPCAALEFELDAEDSRGASCAVLGEGLGRLFDVDPEWLTPKVPGWFGSEDEPTFEQQIALTTAMAIHRYHPKLYALLSGPMFAYRSGWDGHIWLGQAHRPTPTNRRVDHRRDHPRPHVVGRCRREPLLQQRTSRGSRFGHRTHRVGLHACRDRRHQIRELFAQLWDERVAHVREHPGDKAELNGFYWFVMSQKFPVEWWLPRLRKQLSSAWI